MTMPFSAPKALNITSAEIDAGAAGADQHLERVRRDARGRHHLLDRQHPQVDRVQADVADRDDGDADDQRPRNGARRVDGLLGGVGHHVPAAKGEQSGADREQKFGSVTGGNASTAAAGGTSPLSAKPERR